MLKKAGIVVAAAAAGLLAVSPLAFAGDKDHDYKHDHGYSSTETYEDNDQDNDSATADSGILSGNNLSVPVNVCDNQVPVNVLGVQVPVNDAEVLNNITGALGLLGGAEVGDVDQQVDDSCTAQSAIEDNGSASTEG